MTNEIIALPNGSQIHIRKNTPANILLSSNLSRARYPNPECEGSCGECDDCLGAIEEDMHDDKRKGIDVDYSRDLD